MNQLKSVKSSTNTKMLIHKCTVYNKSVQLFFMFPATQHSCAVCVAISNLNSFSASSTTLMHAFRPMICVHLCIWFFFSFFAPLVTAIAMCFFLFVLFIRTIRIPFESVLYKVYNVKCTHRTLSRLI